MSVIITILLYPILSYHTLEQVSVPLSLFHLRSLCASVVCIDEILHWFFICVIVMCRILPKKLWRRGVGPPRNLILGPLLVLHWKLFRRKEQRSQKFVMLLEKLLCGVFSFLFSFLMFKGNVVVDWLYKTICISCKYSISLSEVDVLQWNQGEGKENKRWEEGKEGWSSGQVTKITRQRCCQQGCCTQRTQAWWWWWQALSLKFCSLLVWYSNRVLFLLCWYFICLIIKKLVLGAYSTYWMDFPADLILVL